MLSRLMFREHGQVIRMHSTAREVAITVGVMVIVVMLLAWGQWIDMRASESAAFLAGREVGRAEMADSVADAYAQGVRDARSAMAAGLDSLEVQP